MRREINILFKKLVPSAKIPVYSTDGANGMDFSYCEEMQLLTEHEKVSEILPHTSVIIHTGIALAIPSGYAGLMFARSGLSNIHGIAPADKVSLFDSDYRGEVIMHMYNHSDVPYSLNTGDRISQMCFVETLYAIMKEVDKLPPTKRGNSGFGSSGK